MNNCQEISFIEDGTEVKNSGNDCKLKKNTTTGKMIEINGNNSVCESVAQDDGQNFVKCYSEGQTLEWEVNDNTHPIQACSCESEIMVNPKTLSDPKTGGAKKRKSVKKKKMKKTKKQRKSRKKP